MHMNTVSIAWLVARTIEYPCPPMSTNERCGERSGFEGVTHEHVQRRLRRLVTRRFPDVGDAEIATANFANARRFIEPIITRRAENGRPSRRLGRGLSPAAGYAWRPGPIVRSTERSSRATHRGTSTA
jgi:hypothetical protein